MCSGSQEFGHQRVIEVKCTGQSVEGGWKRKLEVETDGNLLKEEDGKDRWHHAQAKTMIKWPGLLPNTVGNMFWYLTQFLYQHHRGYLKQTSTIWVNHWTWPLSKVKRLVNTRYMKLPPANTTRWLPWKGFWCCCGLPDLEEAHFNTINSATTAKTNIICHAHDQHCVLRTHGCLYYTFT